MLMSDEEIERELKKLDSKDQKAIAELTPIQIKRYARICDYMITLIRDRNKR